MKNEQHKASEETFVVQTSPKVQTVTYLCVLEVFVCKLLETPRSENTTRSSRDISTRSSQHFQDIFTRFLRDFCNIFASAL